MSVSLLAAAAALLWRAMYRGITFDHWWYLDAMRMLVQMGPPMQLYHSQRTVYISYNNWIWLFIFQGRIYIRVMVSECKPYTSLTLMQIGLKSLQKYLRKQSLNMISVCVSPSNNETDSHQTSIVPQGQGVTLYSCKQHECESAVVW